MDLDIFDTFTSTKKRARDVTSVPDSVTFQNDIDAHRIIHKEKERVHAVETPAALATSVETFTVVPEGYDGEVISAAPPVATPAKVYPFKLDTFQQEAVGYIEKGESVLVAAHTSAGKTAVAEYAIAKSLRDKQRVIYTSPIKALSNQKYRDLQEEFKDVGLMTGDMTINPNATCLIMTTEILRSMLYRGSEVVREVAWVIYDEVHYMRDKERGVVWEESIILLPHKIRFVFLSATIPNAKEFVGWVAKLHRQPCHVVYTEYRPTPLQHFVFPGGAEGLYLVVDEKGKFREENFQKAMTCLQAPAELDEKIGNKKSSKFKKNNSIGSDLFKIVRLIMDKELDPCIVFSFSKKDCETYALQMSRLDFNSEEEKELVEQVFMNAMDALSEDDRTLPQVVTILPLLKRGVGIHHGGLLPILKEVIEILFQEGLIKCLFATETFSIGINMPAKTVVFTSTRKFDGRDFRWITSGEYIQMSGRAGRRGKDTSGIVIQMIDEKIDPEVTKDMIYGASDPLYSSYHVSYNMVLNMLRVEDADPENLLRSSFHQFQQEKLSPELEQKGEELQRQASAITVEDEEKVAEYFSWLKLCTRTHSEMYSIMMNPEHSLPFLNPGRLVQLRAFGQDWGWGVLLGHRRKNSNTTTVWPLVTPRCIGFDAENPLTGPAADYILDVLLLFQVDLSDTNATPAMLPHPSCEVDPVGPEFRIEPVQVALRAVCGMSSIRINLPKDYAKEAVRKTIFKSLREIHRRLGKSTDPLSATAIPLLDPVVDMGITDNSFKSLIDRKAELLNRMKSSAFQTSADKSVRLEAYSRKVELLEEARLYHQQAQETQTVAMKEELRKRKRILRQLNYVSSTGVLTVKGRFSCELSTGDELVLTDMIFDGVFNDLSFCQAAALLSCFVHKEAQKETNTGTKLRSDMQGCFRQLQAAARNIAKVSIDARLTCDEEEYVNSFNPALVEVVYAWSSGAKFVDICKLTEVFEGSIIRVVRRLEELLRQLAAAALAIGNAELKKLFEDGADSIRRGVIFAASLYL